ncbi:PRC-barrel domain-containing protein (plasmid) [Lichenicola cladoniae]|uniref:PRC-barrel domain-containing protein n=1 Tax=Lichenicola cladoniae TaxID=1484109 RepID=A0A6M8HYH4_9PROT|nr:PRC-barrel domain-containing protein [Lichenicola cladoniae]NPD69809.1 PRC-barrel domain-containing protein [Acetobacteraceae bacterium]QKE93225.1 PRC-barrel domain-containing protein [Lichenicola cladoniae]
MKKSGVAAVMALSLLVGGGITAQAATNGSMIANSSLQKSHSDWRSSKLVGAKVFDSQGDSIGTIDDMLLNLRGKISNVSISVGGFLGGSSKMAELPFSELKFEPSNSNSNCGNDNDNATKLVFARYANGQDHSAVLLNVSKDKLIRMTPLTYSPACRPGSGFGRDTGSTSDDVMILGCRIITNAAKRRA